LAGLKFNPTNHFNDVDKFSDNRLQREYTRFSTYRYDNEYSDEEAQG
jgi:hypothetical protein